MIRSATLTGRESRTSRVQPGGSRMTPRGFTKAAPNFTPSTTTSVFSLVAWSRRMKRARLTALKVQSSHQERGPTDLHPRQLPSSNRVHLASRSSNRARVRDTPATHSSCTGDRPSFCCRAGSTHVRLAERGGLHATLKNVWE